MCYCLRKGLEYFFDQPFGFLTFARSASVHLFNVSQNSLYTKEKDVRFTFGPFRYFVLSPDSHQHARTAHPSSLLCQMTHTLLHIAPFFFYASLVLARPALTSLNHTTSVLQNHPQTTLAANALSASAATAIPSTPVGGATVTQRALTAATPSTTVGTAVLHVASIS